jgi:translation initiation factor 1A
VNFVISKRKLLTESHLKELLLPQQIELPGQVVKAIGGDNIIVKCPVGKVMTCRIRGKIKRRIWIRENDLVFVTPWNFQSGRVDIIWWYIAAHADKLEQDNYPNDLRQMSDKVIGL